MDPVGTMSDSDSDTSNQSEPEIKKPRLHSNAENSCSNNESAPSDNETGYNSQSFSFGHYAERTTNNLRLSQSSASEACSSPSEDYRASFDSKDDKSSNEEGDAWSGTYGGSAMRMMNKMGYTKGKGLGKHESGRTEPVPASTQKGRLGLGHEPSTLGSVPQDFKWTPDDSKPEAKEEVLWMSDDHHEEVSADLLEDWLIKGEKKMTIDDEFEFCQESIVHGVLSAKNVFDTLHGEEMRSARTKSNPYETIGSLFFLNRAAVKMANIDAICNFGFTKPLDLNGKPWIRDDELLFFADVCAGPGGFSEYVLYRKKWRAKGFGFTLRGPNDFKLSDFYAGPSETFTPYYGPRDDGDIFVPENLDGLRDCVLSQTDDKGVHFLMADGGFSVDGQENLQEILSKQLYLCQCLAGLMLVRTGGHFVVKLFDVFTPFSVSLIYLMYRSYHRVSIHKPVTSRPANSERYLICMHKRAESSVIERHLFKVNEYLYNSRGRSEDVISLVPVPVIKDDKKFFDYVYRSNCVLGEKQIKSLLKIKKFCEDKTLVEPTQKEIRSECLRLWQLPDDVRKKPQRLNSDDTLSHVLSLMKRPRNVTDLNAFKASLMKKPAQMKEVDSLKAFKSIYNVNFEFMSSAKEGECRFYIGTGSNQTYELVDRVWQHESQLNLPAKTLLYGEMTKEFSGERQMQMNIKALHIIDAVCLGGEDVSCKPISERLQDCELFCRSLSKPAEHHLKPIRCKRLFELADLPEVLDKHLSVRRMKSTPMALTCDISNRIDSKQWFHVVNSIVFFPNIKQPWESYMSQSQQRKYYFTLDKSGKINSPSVYELPEAGWLDVFSTLDSRLEWAWEPACAVFNGAPHEGLTRREVENYVKMKLNKI